MKSINLFIGEYFASKEPIIISTILGPCVAVCLYDPIKKIGGMNHILLPGKANTNSYNKPARYGINAMELLINEMMKLGSHPLNFKAKVFGGANVLSTINYHNTMGLKNAEFIIDFLINEKIKIVNQNIGGFDSRKIFFHTETNDVLLKRIKPSSQSLYQTKDFKRKEQEGKLVKKINTKIHKSNNSIIFD
jgi:chemotaxis protein CheD